MPNPTSSPQPLPPATAISAYRDALLHDASAEELVQLAASLHPEEIAWLDVFRAAQREPVALDPAFVARIDRVVAAAPGPGSSRDIHESRGPLRLKHPHAITVRRPPGALSTLPPDRLWRDPRQALPQLATAALLIVLLVAGLFAVGPLRPRQPEQMLGAIDGPVQLEFLWNAPGGDDAISAAYGVGVDPQGNIWVADSEDRFHIVAPDGTYRELWGTSGSGEGEFEFFSRNASVSRGYGDVAFDPDGNIYVADTGNSRIQKFAPDRTFLMSWGSEGEEDGQFLAPSGIAVGPDGTVYVSDEGRDDIQRFGRDGRFLEANGEEGVDPGQFMTPAGVAVASNGDVYVADYGNKRIQHFTASGEFLGSWGEYGREPGQFNSPNDVAVDASGHVYVADDFNNRLQVFSADGRFLATIGTPGKDPGQLSDPLGVAAGPDGVAYVSDYDSIQAFRLVPTDQG
jgi:sugar lactone lactonase YvrE